MGTVLALHEPGPIRGATAEPVPHFEPAQVHVLRYRQLVDEPTKTLDAICDFLGVPTGQVDRIGSSNVSTWVPDSPVNTALRHTIRAGAHLGQFAPPQVWRTVERPLRTALHRGHRNRPEPTADGAQGAGGPVRRRHRAACRS